MDKGDAHNMYNKGEERKNDYHGGEYYEEKYGDEGYDKNYRYENKGVGDEYYYGNGDQHDYDRYGKEGANQLDYVFQVDQGTQMSQGIQMNKNNSRIDENPPSKISSNNPIISEKKDIFELEYPPSRNRSKSTYGFHSSFQARKAAPPKLNKYQYQDNASQKQISIPQNINNPLPKSSLAPSKNLNQSYSNNTANLNKPKVLNYNAITYEKNITRNLYTPQSHSHAFIVNGLVYYTRCPNCNYFLNVDPKSIQGSNQKPNIVPNNQRNNYKRESYQSRTIESQSRVRTIKTEPNSNQREERRLREQKEREEKKLREKKDLEERLKRQREERDRKFREEKEKKEREKKEQKEKQQRDFQRLMEQKEKERKEKRDKDQQQRNLRSQGNQHNQPNQRKEYKYVVQTKNSEYYQNKTITEKVIENPTIPKNYYINEKGVVVIGPPKNLRTSITKIVTVNKPVNSIYQNDGKSFGKSNNMGFYQSQGVETKVIIKPYRK